MKPEFTYFNKVLQLVNEFSFPENSCMDFVNEIEKLIMNLKEEIRCNYTILQTNQFSQYSTLLLKEITELKVSEEKGNVEYIMPWLIKYTFSYSNLQSIFKMDSDLNLYADLSYDKMDMEKYQSWESVYPLQLDFLNFIRANVLNEIRILLSNYVKKEKILKKKHKEFITYFKEGFGPEHLNFLKTIFNQNQSPKEFAIMTCLLTQNNFVIINSRGRTDFYKAWYDFIGLKHPKNSNFTAINKHIEDTNMKGFVFKDSFDPMYVKLEEKIQKIFKS